jgi:methylated-DNA-[protein]-cysteine S-methyltransferase
VRYLQQYYSSNLHGLTQRQFVDHWTFWSPRLDWSGVTAFQRRVLELVAGIPCGCKRTYGQVARALGNPAASRAVGAALRRNPWPVLVPCHRVVGSTGSMTGFTAPGGVKAKRRMLDLEREAGSGEAQGSLLP